tara:strand:- start:11457 stop:12803 length:1347 start_codon:yes stop_codon:yes gene_type:complete
MANSIIYYLKKVYHKDGKDPHISCFLNFLKSDLLFFYTYATLCGNPIEGEEELLSKYIKAKQTKDALSRFIYLCKMKKAKKSVKYDLFFNSLDMIKPHQKMELFSNNTIYYFRLSDIINMWVSCLIKCENMFCCPIKMKNPYTNIEFTDTNLHNIYQCLLCSQYQIPKWITLFFEAGFNINTFSYNNYTLLKEVAIDEFMKNGSTFEKFENIINMTHEYRDYLDYITIESPITFVEKRKIVKKLSPFLKNYLYGEYSCHPLKKKRCRNLARRGLKNYFSENDDIQTYRHRPLPIGLLNSRFGETSNSRSSRRASMLNNIASSINYNLPPSLTLPSIAETNIVSLNPSEEIQPHAINQLQTNTRNTNTREPSSNRENIQQPPPVITTRRENNVVGNHRNGSLFNLNLTRRQNNDPFSPTFTLNRTPRRGNRNNGSSSSTNSINMRMFNR